ncbi:hypothetical protein [Kordia antarctica]|uniref:hypothetical protein n=1 Tax=Kordia antarctica TaxID=1218801 RepID=UPI00135ABD2E|nr:hypothetical protein [Kordia antarctica]
MQVDTGVFIYEAYLSKDIIKLKKVSLQEFMNNSSYGSLSCILTKMMNDDLEDLLDDHITTNSHHSTYISCVDGISNIETQILRDSCFRSK